eukprot:Lankesteria_metandrocarpae@DN4115_c0_g1_i1.p1
MAAVHSGRTKGSVPPGRPSRTATTAGDPDVVEAPVAVTAGQTTTGTVWECVTPPDDPCDDSLAKVPEPRSQVAGCSLDEKAYYFGGRSGGSTPTATRVNDDFYLFDGSTLVWSEVQLSEASVRPSRRYAASLVASADNSSVFLFGGSDGTNSLSDIWQFKVEDKTWYRVSTSGSDKPKPVHSHSAVVHDNHMWIYGGWISEWGRTEKMYKLNLKTFKWDALTFQKGSGVPERRFGHVAAVHEGSMYVFAGAKSVGVTNELWKFDFATEKWNAVVPVEASSGLLSARGGGYPADIRPAPRKFPACTVLDGKWLVHGGCNSGDVPTAELWVYDFALKTWWTSEQLSTLRSRDSHVLIQLKCPNISRLCVSFGRVKKNEETNVSMILSLMEGRASKNYTEDNEILRNCSRRLLEPESEDSLLSSAQAMFPVVKNKDQFVEELSQRFIEMSPGNELLITATSGAGVDDTKLVESVQSYQKLVGIVLGSVEEYSRLVNTPAAQVATDRALTESKLTALLTEHGISQEDANVIMPSQHPHTLLGGLPPDAAFAEILSLRTQSAMVTANSVLTVVEGHLSDIWDNVLLPVFSETTEQDNDTATITLNRLQEQEDVIQHNIRDTSIRLLSTLAIKERRSFEQKRMDLSLAFLQFYEKEVDEIKGTLKTVPGSTDAPEFDDAVLHKHMHELRSALEAQRQSAKDTMVSMQTKIDALKSEQQKSAHRAAKETEANRLKRENCGLKRKAILTSIEEFLASKMKEYMEVVEDERGALLCTELTHREDIELQRRVDVTCRSFEAPMEIQHNLELATRGFVVIVDEFQRRCEMSIGEVKEKSTTSASNLASKLVVARHRVEMFADTLTAALVEVHDRQTKTLGKLQENLNSMLNKLELLENTGEPDELQSNDEGSAFSEPLSKPTANKESEVCDSAIAEALTMGPHSQGDAGPYHTTLHKYHQYKQLYERLRVEAALSAQNLEYVSELKTRLRHSIDTFWSDNLGEHVRDEVPENSYLDLLKKSKFDWEKFDAERTRMLIGVELGESIMSPTVLTGSVFVTDANPASTSRFSEVTDENWISSFYNIDPTKVHDTSTAGNSPDHGPHRPPMRGTARFGPTGTMTAHRLGVTRGVMRSHSNIGLAGHRGVAVSSKSGPLPVAGKGRGGGSVGNSFVRVGGTAGGGGDAAAENSSTRRGSRLPAAGGGSTSMASPSPSVTGGGGSENVNRFGGGQQFAKNNKVTRLSAGDDSTFGLKSSARTAGRNALNKTFAGPAPDTHNRRNNKTHLAPNSGDGTSRSRMSSNNNPARAAVNFAGDDSSKAAAVKGGTVSTFAGATRRTAKA